MADVELNEVQRADKARFTDFLEQDHGQNVYTEKIAKMAEKDECRLIVSINDLRQHDAALAKRLVTSPGEVLPVFDMALQEYVSQNSPELSKTHPELFVGIEGSFGAHHLTPRGLSARFLGTLVLIEGIVTKCSLVRPKLVTSVHYCKATKKTETHHHRDQTSFLGPPTGNTYPKTDPDGNPLETEFGLSRYIDHQTITMQEMPESAPAGQLPRSVDVILDYDLADKVKPGDRVQMVGVYRAMSSKSGNATTAVFRTVVIANNVRVLGKEVLQPVLSDVDIRNIRRLAGSKKVDVFELLARSLAPSIYGQEHIKQGLLCLLLGGMEKNLPNGTHLRGDINMLMVGDPSTAKSQILRFALNTAPLAIATTGRGSSGVGLTAAVTTDNETGERRLEAGAMVLADRGIVCIDEFDKMSDVDRVAIHEVMEQQTVTIAKAGIHTSLNARCSVLAAANPVYGQYDQYKSPMENICLPDSLLSRFDLLFIVLDTMEPEHDRAISDHVLRMHRYRRPGEAEGAVLPMEQGGTSIGGTRQEAAPDNEETPVYEKYDALLHGPRVRSRQREEGVLSLAFVRKYIHYAKNRIKPKLTQEAAKLLGEVFAELRNDEDKKTHKTMPITARTLESLIRLATAHAKARLSNQVQLEDAIEAADILRFALFQEKVRRPRRARQDSEDEDGEGGDDNGDGNGGDGDDKQNKDKTPAKRSRKGRRDGDDDEEGEGSEEEEGSQQPERESQETPRARRSPRAAGRSQEGQASQDSQDPFRFVYEESAAAVGERAGSQRTPRSASRRKQPAAAEADTPRDEEMADAEAPATGVEVSEERAERFRKQLSAMFLRERSSSRPMADIVHEFEKDFTRAEINALLRKMHEENKVMTTPDAVYLV